MLGAPPAFILSQDRTLRSNQRANGPFIPCTGCRSVAPSAVSEFKIRIRLVKGTKGCYVAHFVTSTSLVCLVDLIDRSIRFSRFARAAPARPVGPAGRSAGMKYTRPRGRPQGGGGVSTGRTHLRLRELTTSTSTGSSLNVILVSYPQLKGLRPANPSAQAKRIRLIEKAVDRDPNTSNR